MKTSTGEYFELTNDINSKLAAMDFNYNPSDWQYERKRFRIINANALSEEEREKIKDLIHITFKSSLQNLR